ncbi:triose-phosphate isomerase family protein [Clavibacter tessellarius]|uniref:triose-phosphate isomerase family protein n=1 Tax=Clavibacter tessellarius TaxID=31965 RepID=UPI0039E9B90A
MSLKMHLGHAETVAWCEAVADVARAHPAIAGGEAELVVLPSYLSVPAALGILDGVAAVGAQDLAAEDSGAFTGEVSGGQIRELGGAFVEVGHAERRRLFGETDEVVRRKADAALRNGLVPLICVGEERRGDRSDAARECVRQLDDALALAAAAGHGGRIVVAYEPHWAIGAAEPASDAHIRACAGSCARTSGRSTRTRDPRSSTAAARDRGSSPASGTTSTACSSAGSRTTRGRSGRSSTRCTPAPPPGRRPAPPADGRLSW